METIMNIMERTSHPSYQQVQALVAYLKQHPELAKGFARTQGARDKARKHWLNVALKLNAMGSGAIKSWVQWTKYWRDKKSAIKKKAAARSAAMLKNNGVVDDNLELSEIEERILAIMGADELILRKDTSKNINEDSEANVTIKIESQSSNESPDYDGDAKEIQDPLQTDISNHDVEIENNIRLWQDITEPTASTSNVSEKRQVLQEDDDVDHLDNRNTSAPKRVKVVHTAHPILSDRYLKIEEQRLSIEKSNSEIIKLLVTQSLERDKQIAIAMHSVGDGLKALAEVLNKNGKDSS